MTKRDYYEILGVASRRSGLGAEGRVPQAGAQVPPRPQSGQQGRRGAFQGSGRGVRGAVRSAEARRLRSLRPCGRQRAGRLRSVHLRRLRGHPRRPGRSLRLRRRVRRRPAAGWTAAGRAPPLRPRDLVRGVGARRPKRRSSFPRAESCDTCRGSGAAPGSTPTTCPACGGRGQLRYQQGFFTVARTCHQCRGVGQVITKPCATCHGEGRITKRAQAHREDPGRHRHRSAAAAARRGRARRPPVDLPAISTS